MFSTPAREITPSVQPCRNRRTVIFRDHLEVLGGVEIPVGHQDLRPAGQCASVLRVDRIGLPVSKGRSVEI